MFWILVIKIKKASTMHIFFKMENVISVKFILIKNKTIGKIKSKPQVKIIETIGEKNAMFANLFLNKITVLTKGYKIYQKTKRIV